MVDEENRPNRMERRKEATRRRIIEAAYTLFEKHGFEATSMESIAEEADVAKGTLYNHFPAKEAIVAEEIRQTLSAEAADWMSTLRDLPDTSARMAFLFRELLSRIDTKRDIFAHFLRYRMQRMVVLQWEWEESVKTGVPLFGEAIIAMGREQGDLRDDIEPAAQEELFEFVLLSLIKKYYASPDFFDFSTSCSQVIDLFLNGTGKR